MQNSEQKQDIKVNTLSYWEFWRHVAPGMLKRISGGSLNGMTDINPVWRFQALTEAFGPCGFGWKIREAERWTCEACGEIAAFVKVELYINIGGTWSEPIEGVGGSKLVRRDKNGTNLTDEAWKMATTDAISVACKSLGIAADVYIGRQSHSDPDQKADGPDYGTKYEPRNYGQNSTRNSPAGNYTTQGLRGQSAPRNAAPAGGYGPGPVNAATGAPAPQYQQPAPPVAQDPAKRVHVILATVTTGRCKNLISALAGHDYDDLADWQAGIEALKARYFIDADALEEIQRRAIEERNARLQQQVPQYEDLP